MGLFYSSNENKNEANVHTWSDIENFILEYTAITSCTITSINGLLIVSKNGEQSEFEASNIINYIDSYEHDFNIKTNFVQFVTDENTTLIFKKYDFYIIVNITSGSEEMVKRRVFNALTTYDNLLKSYCDFI